MGPLRRERQGFHKQPLPGLRPAVHEMIGRRLRLHYEELQQPLPGRLEELMEELDKIAGDAAPPRKN